MYMRSSRQCINIGKYKAKAIHADLGIFTHISTYSDISRHVQAYSGILRTLLTLKYSKSWFIQNLDKFRARGIFRTLVYSEPSHIQNPGVFCENI